MNLSLSILSVLLIKKLLTICLVLTNNTKYEISKMILQYHSLVSFNLFHY